MGTDEWKCRCNLPPAGGKLHLPYFSMRRILAIRHRCVEMSVQLAARWRQVAPPALSDASDIGYRAQVWFVAEPAEKGSAALGQT